MKRNILVTLALIATLLLTSTAAHADKVNIGPNGQMTIVSGDDTMSVSAGKGLSRLGVKISDAINDTIINMNQGDSASVASVDTGVGPVVSLNELKEWKEISHEWAWVAQNIAMLTLAAVLAAMLLVLVFRYLNRRSKLRVIEKAIENNYPLPAGIFSESKRMVVVQQPTTSATAPAANAVGNNDAAQQQVPVGTPMAVNFLSWDVLKSPIKWAAWGVGLTLFGALEWATPFLCVGIALIVVGATKAYVRYQEVKGINEQLSQQRTTPPTFKTDNQ